MLLSTLQLIALVPLMSLNFPANFIGYAKFLAVVNGEPGSLPNVFEDYIVSAEDLVPHAFNSNYAVMGKLYQTNEDRFPFSILRL